MSATGPLPPGEAFLARAAGASPIAAGLLFDRLRQRLNVAGWTCSVLLGYSRQEMRAAIYPRDRHVLVIAPDPVDACDVLAGVLGELEGRGELDDEAA